MPLNTQHTTPTTHNAPDHSPSLAAITNKEVPPFCISQQCVCAYTANTTTTSTHTIEGQVNTHQPPLLSLLPVEEVRLIAHKKTIYYHNYNLHACLWSVTSGKATEVFNLLPNVVHYLTVAPDWTAGEGPVPAHQRTRCTSAWWSSTGLCPHHKDLVQGEHRLQIT